jgi:hypothetical protein
MSDVPVLLPIDEGREGQKKKKERKKERKKESKKSKKAQLEGPSSCCFHVG